MCGRRHSTQGLCPCWQNQRGCRAKLSAGYNNSGDTDFGPHPVFSAAKASKASALDVLDRTEFRLGGDFG
ncbi:MAG: hypothetical protein KatS3mg110_3022 [Pirellulaceae bacterium]|nr:MAG: hypothetical protein KatS3mg110_3022 [Pirellulaceae bacterium]